jgi:16S rRNA U516 pseudouridylate synthase RsuA-like enzyme
MCATVGLPVDHLHRRRYGGLRLVGLAQGQWRELTPDEVSELRRLAGP